VPGDAFALAVFVGRQDQLVGILEQVLELLDHLFLVGRHHIQGLEVIVDVHTQPGPFLALELGRNVGGLVGQIADVPHRGGDVVSPGQEIPDSAGLGGRFDDDQRRHDSP
jgi:hypothetical protein